MPIEQTSPSVYRKPSPVTSSTVPPRVEPRGGSTEITRTAAKNRKPKGVCRILLPSIDTPTDTMLASIGGVTHRMLTFDLISPGALAFPKWQSTVPNSAKFVPWTTTVVPPPVVPAAGLSARIFGSIMYSKSLCPRPKSTPLLATRRVTRPGVPFSGA
eukprot:scaffold172_cov254-Pinguiococcus_pyrenoidosus.AAC.31